MQFKSIDLSTIEYNTYQLNLINYNNNKINYSLVLRTEEELTSEEKYQLFKEVAFFDFNTSYNLGAFNISISLENVFNFRDSDFSIEPDLSNDLSIFVHEPNFIFKTGIAYTF